jgi:hypothetical protein
MTKPEIRRNDESSSLCSSFVLRHSFVILISGFVISPWPVLVLPPYH